jgi:hypothetical protein
MCLLTAGLRAGCKLAAHDHWSGSWVLPFDGQFAQSLRAATNRRGVFPCSSAKRFREWDNSFRDTGGYLTSRVSVPIKQSGQQATKNHAGDAEAARQPRYASGGTELASQSEGKLHFGRGTVHQGFQLVYYSIRENLRKLVAQHASNCKELVITGHSLGGALAALTAPDLLNDVAARLSPSLYTWAEPWVGHGDFVSFFNTHVNICYRIVNVWDVVPHLPPVLAAYEHERNGVTIDSGFSFDIVRNHVLATGYVPGMAQWSPIR